MKKTLLLPGLILLLTGCSSSSNDAFQNLKLRSGGQSMGDATSFYWMTERVSDPIAVADHVNLGDYGWYKTDYRWEDRLVRELIREGEQQLEDGSLVPYRIHLRFNGTGEAIYQQYRFDGKVKPIHTDEIIKLQREAQNVVVTSREQSRKGLSLIQGYWDGSEFESCSGRTYRTLDFNQSLPSFVIDRLASEESYLAFIGETSRFTATIGQLLVLADDNYACINEPRFLED